MLDTAPYIYRYNNVLISCSLDLDDLLSEEQLQLLDVNEYHPFPNKVFALLYFLLQGPRPVISNDVHVIGLL